MKTEVYRPKFRSAEEMERDQARVRRAYGEDGAELAKGRKCKACGTFMKYVSCGNCVQCAKERDARRELQKKPAIWCRQIMQRQEAY